MGSCRRCPEPVLWVRTPAGKAMPVDPEPSADGNVAVRRDGRGAWLGRVVTAELPLLPYERLHLPHFATCAPTVAHRQGVRDGSVIELSRARKPKRRTR